MHLQMTDEWARGLQGGWGSDSVQALETKALQITQAEAGMDAAQATFVAIAQAVAAAVEVEVPEAMIQEVGRMEFQKQATQYVLEVSAVLQSRGKARGLGSCIACTAALRFERGGLRMVPCPPGQFRIGLLHGIGVYMAGKGSHPLLSPTWVLDRTQA